MNKFPLIVCQNIFLYNGQCGERNHTKASVCLCLEFSFRIHSPVSAGIFFKALNICGMDPKDAHFVAVIQSMFFYLEPSLLTYFQLRRSVLFIKAKIVKLGSLK